MKLSLGSLFAGIGGIELGLERTQGFETTWQVENDPFAQRVLRKHWPQVRRVANIRDFPAEPHDGWEVDVICGGFPCQPISTAGQQKGDKDERWLWDEMHRVCKTLKPRWIVVENVRGLLSADRGRLMGRVVGDLGDIGYCVEWSLLSACAVGASHTRSRVFIVAYPNRYGLQGVFGQLAQEHDRKKGESRGQLSSGCNSPKRRSWVELPSPVFCRSSDGIPHRVDRTRCLGNAVVPHVAEWIGQRILEVEYATKND